MTRFSNDSLQLHGVLNGSNMSAAVTLRGLGQLAHNLGITTIGPNSGAPYNETRFVGERKPEITGTVAALKSLLDTLSLLGTNCMGANEGRPGVQAFLQSHNACAPNARTAGSNHRRITVAKSQILITTLGGARGQSATANVRVMELSTDGTASPEAIVNNAALPGTFVADEEFVIGAPLIGNIQLAADHVASWQIDTGINLTAVIAAGSIYPTVVYIEKVAPRITVVHDDPTLLGDASIPANGLACTHANTLFPLHRRTSLGGLYLPTDAQHIKITAAGFAYHSRHYDASGSAVGTGEITIECIEGAGGVPLTATTAQTLA